MKVIFYEKRIGEQRKNDEGDLENSKVLVKEKGRKNVDIEKVKKDENKSKILRET